MQVKTVLQCLLEKKVFVKAFVKKCELSVPSVSFLGYILAKEQLRPDPAKIKAVVNW